MPQTTQSMGQELIGAIPPLPFQVHPWCVVGQLYFFTLLLHYMVHLQESTIYMKTHSFYTHHVLCNYHKILLALHICFV
jgi:hypothetical protein